MFRDENEIHAPELEAELTIETTSYPETEDDLKELYRLEGGGKRGAKYRMFLEDGFDPEAAWYFSGPEYTKKMKRYDDENRLGIKYCNTCDRVIPEPPKKKELTEKQKQMEQYAKEAYAVIGVGKRGRLFHTYLMDGFSEDAAWYFSGPEWAAEVRQGKEEERLAIKRCKECHQILPGYREAYEEMMIRLEDK